MIATLPGDESGGVATTLMKPSKQTSAELAFYRVAAGRIAEVCGG